MFDAYLVQGEEDTEQPWRLSIVCGGRLSAAVSMLLASLCPRPCWLHACGAARTVSAASALPVPRSSKRSRRRPWPSARSTCVASMIAATPLWIASLVKF
jgi:hypothetical protein